MYVKKILFTLFILFSFSLQSFAEYKPIPQDLKSAYKKEIEFTIKKEAPKSKKLIDDITKKINSEKNPYNKQTLIDYGITSILFDFYMQLTNVTNKYVEIKQDIPATDWYIELREFINPYLKDNNINIKTINSLLIYAERKQLKIEKQYSNY